MAPDAKEILDAALRLNDREKAAIAASLIDSLDPEQDESSEKAWADEVAKRVHEMDNGEVATVAWADARKMILEPIERADSD